MHGTLRATWAIALATALALGLGARPGSDQPTPSDLAAGTLVDAGGHALYIRCAGTASTAPTVVLEAGGGVLARLYADRYGREVAGVVLVDPTHESEVLGSMRLRRMVRLRELATGRPIPEPHAGRALASPAVPPDSVIDYLPEELQLLYLARQRHPTPLGDRPLVVLAAGRRPAPPGMPESEWAPLREEKNAHRADLAHLSRNARLVVDSASGHDIPTENPRLVARAIEDVVAAVRTGRRLTP